MTVSCAARTLAAALWVSLMLLAISWFADQGIWWAVVPVAAAAIVGAKVICGFRERAAG